MANYPTQFLLANLALAFYLVGCIWAREVDIFRNATEPLVPKEDAPDLGRSTA